jgi:hypothetical protein
MYPHPRVPVHLHDSLQFSGSGVVDDDGGAGSERVAPQ